MKRLLMILFLVLLFAGSAFAAVDDFFFGVAEMAWSSVQWPDDGFESTFLKTDASGIAGEDAEQYVAYYQWQESAVAILETESSSSLLSYTTKDRNLALPGDLRIGDPITKALNIIPGEAMKEGDMYVWVDKSDLLDLPDLPDNPFALILFTDNGTIHNLTYMKIDMGNVKLHKDYGMYLDRSDIQSAPQPSAPATPQRVQRVQPSPVKKPKANTAESLFGGQPDTPAPVQGNDSANTANLSTDSKVINFYPLTPGEKNTLGIQHRAAYKFYSARNYRRAYETFSKLADQYSCNYLSAYWAGESAMKLRKRDDAKAWYDKALAINPDYKPAIDARANLK